MLPKKRYFLPDEKPVPHDQAGRQLIKQQARTREVRDVVQQTAVGAAALYGQSVVTTIAQENRGLIKTHALDVADRANRESQRIVEQHQEDSVYRARLEGLDERLDDQLGTDLMVAGMAYGRAATKILDRELIRELPEPRKGVLTSIKSWLLGDDKV